MVRAIQVYLHDEDEAEQLKAKLSKYDTQDVLIDYLEATSGLDLVVPLIQTGTTIGDTPDSSVGTSNASAYYVAAEDDASGKSRNTVLSFQIKEEDVEDVLIEIHKAGGYVDQAFFKK
ncbi:hypothetical protein SAMN04488134_104126 [Amphibacillus marinus]|uniref:Heat induced stress protein YflT n=1 Tax=Amphibacillus marinus TaxID=872970 RepID=A0A1H8MEC0_9BACI|nr:hypothetical protein [Amphibacillus marinus]SEO15634.1 hypothetical protein SAMN04488134_104126 [Amphibacillus marinus]